MMNEMNTLAVLLVALWCFALPMASIDPMLRENGAPRGMAEAMQFIGVGITVLSLIPAILLVVHW